MAVVHTHTKRLIALLIGGPAAAVFVEELKAGGAADKSGRVAQGDVLTSCSAVVLKSGQEGGEAEGYGERLYDNWERVTFDCKGQAFKTVMSALKSNNPRWGHRSGEGATKGGHPVGQSIITIPYMESGSGACPCRSTLTTAYWYWYL